MALETLHDLYVEELKDLYMGRCVPIVQKGADPCRLVRQVKEFVG